MVKGILFDVDGVLIDSERYINQAAVEFFASIGVTVKPEDFIPFVGAGEDRYLGGVAQIYGVGLSIEEAKVETYRIYERLISGNEGVLPGVLRLLTNAHNAGIPMAIATSADRLKMEINLKVMNLDPAWFKVVLNGKDIERKKPFPDIYLKAAEGLGLCASDCVVFEDAVNGVQAAKAAGASCVALTTSFEAERLRRVGADAVIATLDDIENFSEPTAFNRHLVRLYAREEAYKTRLHAYTPYSHFKVGAAVVSAATGSVYGGCNVENSSYGATICAERGAIMKAISTEGDLTVDMVVVVSDDDPPAPPCANCLQVLAEFCTKDSEINLYDLRGQGRRYRFDELLPYPFIFPSQRGKRP